jgi:hypothetical protein
MIPPRSRTFWLPLAALSTLGFSSVVALSAEGPLPCGARLWAPTALADTVNRFCQRWVQAPGDSCDPVRSFLPDHDGKR